ncbi:putative flavin-containing monooxygenase 1 [Prunus yedoensis var. nudiflora]|uniref:Flavin-containing monooxygenase n=1 Tax=Prunus yedoensis var. nudiflora TaxID=2094558 RepID=A0A314ZI92_PRUYE|nr:putative flavin-containing monooxygenase 1 [Prunus yedoensis var. nudiflora]
MGKKVAIIGAGTSGLIACKYTLSKGFQPIVFESASTIGGVWTKTIETTKLRTPREVYQFSDFPWSSSVTEDFPNQHQVLDYIKSYAHQVKQFGRIFSDIFHSPKGGIYNKVTNPSRVRQGKQVVS